MDAQSADDVRVDQALSLLWHAARISPPLREAVDIVEGAIDRFRQLRDDRFGVNALLNDGQVSNG